MKARRQLIDWRVPLLLAVALLVAVACSWGSPADEQATPPAPTVLAPTPTLTTVAPEPLATRIPNTLFQADALPIPPDRDLYALAQRLMLKSTQPIPRIVNPGLVVRREGEQETFWITDLVALNVRSARATLRVISEHAYWYVEDGLNISTEDLRRASRVFEETIYPTVTRFFGDIWIPGVDNDPRLVILHTRIPGLAGYYSSSDEYPKAVHIYSNEREVIYLDGETTRVGSSSYLGTLAHEFQHAIHWNADPDEESWVNEGLSEVAKDLAGYRAGFVDSFLRSPETSLIDWPSDPAATPPHYGGANLFFFYLAQHYGGYESLKRLVQRPEDGIAGVNAYLAELGYKKTFLDVFKDWVVANYLDAPDGPYSYADRNVRVQVSKVQVAPGQREGRVSQFGTDYIDVRLDKGDARITFEGDREVRLLPTEPVSGSRCWWGNRGDAIDSTLTRRFDLSGVGQVALNFWVWYDIEESWDYAYVEVSTDSGVTWDILKGKYTSPANPVGNSFGDGLTGQSKEWLQESIDLSPYAGREVLLRFEYVTDDAVNSPGLCIDDISIPQLGFFDDAEGNKGWEAKGFVRIDNRLAQDYIVQVIEKGGSVTVREMTLDEQQRGQITIQGFGSKVTDAILVISPTTPVTSESARYTVKVEKVSG